jgi:hypothetical protein
MDEHEFRYRQEIKAYYARLASNHIVEESVFLLQHRNKDKPWGCEDAFADLHRFCKTHVEYLKDREVHDITISNAQAPAIWLALHLNYHRWSPYDLGKRTGKDEAWAQGLLDGSRPIDEEASLLLAAAFDTHPLFWLHAYKVWEDRRRSER